MFNANKEHMNSRQNPNEASSDVNITKNAQDIQKIERQSLESDSGNEIHNTESLKDIKQERQTYGLLILELMSDEEYAAFQRATAGMSEGEKIMAAHSLYTLSAFYQERIHPQKTNLQNQNPYAKVQNSDDFIKKYQAFYNGAQNFDSLS